MVLLNWAKYFLILYYTKFSSKSYVIWKEKVSEKKNCFSFQVHSGLICFVHPSLFFLSDVSNCTWNLWCGEFLNSLLALQFCCWTRTAVLLWFFFFYLFDTFSFLCLDQAEKHLWIDIPIFLGGTYIPFKS